MGATNRTWAFFRLLVADTIAFEVSDGLLACGSHDEVCRVEGLVPACECCSELIFSLEPQGDIAKRSHWVHIYNFLDINLRCLLSELSELMRAWLAKLHHLGLRLKGAMESCHSLHGSFALVVTDHTCLRDLTTTKEFNNKRLMRCAVREREFNSFIE